MLISSNSLFGDCDINKRELIDCDFSGKSFERYNFSNKKLSNINFSNSNLFAAIFNKTKLDNVKFKKANLFGAYFVESSLNSVDFTGADISSADFTGASVSLTSFFKATKEDTIFGAMKIETPDVIKIKNCKLIVDNKHKLDWANFVLSMSVKGAGGSGEFVVSSLCKNHPKSTFFLRGITSSRGKKKLSINSHSCIFPVLVWFEKANNRIYLEDNYRSVCLKESYVSSSRGGAVVKGVGINVEWTCGFIKSCSTDKNLRVSGPGYVPSYENGRQKTQLVSRMNNALEGSYSFSVSANKGKIKCSGSFNLSGKKRNYTIRLYDSCKDAGSGEWDSF